MRVARTVTITVTVACIVMATRSAAAQDGGVSAEVDPVDEAAIERALKADAAKAGDRPASGGPVTSPGAAAPAGAGAVSGMAPAFQSMNPDIALVADVALARFSRDTNLQSGAHDPTKTGFNLQQLELVIQKAVDPYFRFDSFIVFSQFGVEVEEAYATTLSLPGNLQVRAGQFLTRFGRINPTHPHSWDFVDQPFAIGRIFGGEGNRGLGAEVSYLMPLPWYVEVVASMTDPAGEATARSFYGARDLGIRSPFDLQGTLAIKQFFPLSEDWSLLWGVSAAGGPNPTGHGNRTEVYGTDLYLKYRPITTGGVTAISLQTEWFHRRRQVPEDVLEDLNGYAQGVWRFALRWGTAVRYEFGSRTWAAEGRNTADYLDLYWTDHRHRASANLTFWPTEFSRLRLQGSADVPRWESQPTWALFVAMEIVIGAHGAHHF